MSTEVWFRNPDLYIRELVEERAGFLAWDRGYAIKKSIDPLKHAALHYPADQAYRILMVGEQGTAEYRRGDTWNAPHAVYPTWEYGQDIEILEELLASNVGDDPHVCGDTSIPDDERPVLGQEHRVVIIRPPSGGSGPGRAFFTMLKNLQAEYPDATIHVHGVYSYRIAFGLGYRAADVECRLLARNGKVALPTGKEMAFEQTIKCPQWVTLLGLNVSDLKIARNRCIYNIRSARWAGEHFTEVIKFKSTGRNRPDTSSPGSIVPVAAPTTRPTGSGVAQQGDKYHCDTCSLQNSCKYYRQGSVCAVPGSEPASLAKLFNSRDSDTIIGGLGALLASQVARLERGMEDEVDYGELDPEVTKIANLLFKGGRDLAKLVDPALRAGPTTAIQINAGSGASVTQVKSPNQIMAGIVAELEARGVRREDITPEMIQGLLEQMATPANAPGPAAGAITAHVASSGSDE